MKSQNLLGQLDPTGMSGSLVKDLQQLLDTYLMDGFLWKEPMPGIVGKKGQSKLNLTDINNEISSADLKSFPNSITSLRLRASS